MSTKFSTDRPPSRRLLWAVVVLMATGAAMLWGSSAVNWAVQTYRTPFSGDRVVAVTGSLLRPELAPMALAVLAAIAAVLATAGLLRRVVGAVVAAVGVLLGWRTVLPEDFDWFAHGPQVPPGSEPVGELATQPAGPLLMAGGALLVLVGGVLVLLRPHRMPAMGAKYAAPAEARRESRDPDRRFWDSLDAGEDPTDERGQS